MSDNFLNRWSRLKSEAKSEPKQDASPAAAPAAEEPVPPPDLPPVESLTKDSDFAAFLKEGVPEHLKKAALAKLWTSDPLFSQPEIYDLHMEDYSAPSVPELVKTAWKVGKGIVDNLAERESVDPPQEEIISQGTDTPTG